ncbi:GSCOCG00000965001-RA-CDS [Cotesia congregata]|nr:GSCOCG00000965001-RA-CDS [Cotesia congregata]
MSQCVWVQYNAYRCSTTIIMYRDNDRDEDERKVEQHQVPFLEMCITYISNRFYVKPHQNGLWLFFSSKLGLTLSWTLLFYFLPYNSTPFGITGFVVKVL